MRPESSLIKWLEEQQAVSNMHVKQIPLAEVDSRGRTRTSNFTGSLQSIFKRCLPYFFNSCNKVNWSR